MEHKSGPYGRLGLMVLLSFVAMYVLMYAMVDRFANVFNSINQAYMAALMAAPMLVIELALMGSMYPNKKLNAALMVAGVAALALLWMLIRVQGAVGDWQFLRSMIPHHAGAILMCQEASLADPGVADLCRRIVRNQEEEIAEMKERLGKLAAR